MNVRPLCALLVVAMVGAVGCKNATPLGTKCSSQSDCHDVDQVCAPGFDNGQKVCTHTCTTNVGATGCPIGWDCYPTDATLGHTCNKALYEVDSTTGAPLLFGVACGLDGNACKKIDTANPKPECRKIADRLSNPPVAVDEDPNAYCTGYCADDGDCPLDFECVTDYDSNKVCLKRSLCSPCTVDLNCDGIYATCVPTKDGSAHYCSKTCGSVGDCGGNQNTAYECNATTDIDGNAVKACQHRYGACVGEGKICDPCRVTADCAASKSQCLTNTATNESFCSKGCTSDSDCTPDGKVPAVCDNTDIYNAMTNPGGMSLQACNGDVSHQTPGLFSCWTNATFP